MEQFDIIENGIKMNNSKTVGIINLPHLLLPFDKNDVELKIIGISENEVELDVDEKTELDKIVIFTNIGGDNLMWCEDEHVHIAKKWLDLAFETGINKKVMCHKSKKGNLCYIKNNENYIIIAGVEVKNVKIQKCGLMNLYKPTLMSFF